MSSTFLTTISSLASIGHKSNLSPKHNKAVCLFYFKSFSWNKICFVQNLLKEWRRNAKKFHEALPLIVANPIERSIVGALLLLPRKLWFLWHVSCCSPLFANYYGLGSLFYCPSHWNRLIQHFGLRGCLNYHHYYFQLLLFLFYLLYSAHAEQLTP